MGSLGARGSTGEEEGEGGGGGGEPSISSTSLFSPRVKKGSLALLAVMVHRAPLGCLAPQDRLGARARMATR